MLDVETVRFYLGIREHLEVVDLPCVLCHAAILQEIETVTGLNTPAVFDNFFKKL